MRRYPTGVMLGLVMLMTCLTLMGCGIIKTQTVREGHNIHQETVDQIVIGQTTEREILKLFGPPTKMREDGGKLHYFYEYKSTGGLSWNLGISLGGSSHVKSLSVWFDEQRVVEDVAFLTD